MNVEKRIEILEKEVGVDMDEEVPEEVGWREKLAQKMLPILRVIARIAQYEDSPLPSDEELLRRARASMSHWSSQGEYLKAMSDPRTTEIVKEIVADIEASCSES